MRTKRREKRTKLLLRAFGNIYPPFIVTPLFRNLKYIHRGSAPPPPPSSPAHSPQHSPFRRILCAQSERRRQKIAQTKPSRPAESGASKQAGNGRLMSGSRCPRRPLFPAAGSGAALIQDGRSLPSQQSQTWITPAPSWRSCRGGVEPIPQPDTPRRAFGSPQFRPKTRCGPA